MKKIKNISKKTIILTMGIILGAAGSVFAAWQSTDWISNGAIIDPVKLKENLDQLKPESCMGDNQFLRWNDNTKKFVCSIALLPNQTCLGDGKALQWDGNAGNFKCETVSGGGGASDLWTTEVNEQAQAGTVYDPVLFASTTAKGGTKIHKRLIITDPNNYNNIANIGLGIHNGKKSLFLAQTVAINISDGKLFATKGFNVNNKLDIREDGSVFTHGELNLGNKVYLNGNGYYNSSGRYYPYLKDDSSSKNTGNIQIGGTRKGIIFGQNILVTNNGATNGLSFVRRYNSTTKNVDEEYFKFNFMNGDLVLKKGTVNETSDIRLKKDIKKINSSLEKIKKISGVEFNWKSDNQKSIGVIAQDVEKVFPELVSQDEISGIKSVAYAKLVAPLIEAVKEQQKMIEELQKEVKDLKKN